MPRALLGCARRRTQTPNATKRTPQRARSDAARALNATKRTLQRAGSDAARALGVRAPPDSPGRL